MREPAATSKHEVGTSLRCARPAGGAHGLTAEGPAQRAKAAPEEKSPGRGGRRGFLPAAPLLD
jgi:hypothetical protein